MRRPESAPALCVPIVMLINLHALPPKQREVTFGEPGSHYHAITLDQQTNSIQRGGSRHFYELLSFRLPTVRAPHMRTLDVFPASF